MDEAKVDGSGAKELRHAKALDEVLVGIVGSEGKAGSIVGKVVGCGGLGAVQDSNVMGLEELVGKV